ncbi:hypothetical protein D1X02_08635 [Salmonella enterica]|nr:hypothetical protein [Salmonella enterica]
METFGFIPLIGFYPYNTLIYMAFIVFGFQTKRKPKVVDMVSFWDLLFIRWDNLAVLSAQLTF